MGVRVVVTPEAPGSWGTGEPGLASEDQQPLYEACICTPVHPLVAVCSSLSGDGIKGSELASGWHGDVRQCGLLRVTAAADVGGHHRAGNHQAAAGNRLEVRTQTPVFCFPEPLKEETVLFSWVVNLPSMFAYQCLCSKSF